MAFTMTGKIHKIMPIETIVSKKDPSKSFQKRAMVLDCTRFDQFTGQRGYDNYPSFDFSGDKCAELDNYKVGQIVTLSFDLQGNKYTDSNGQEKYFTSIRGFKIELKGQTQQSNNTTTPIEQVSQQLQNNGLVATPVNIANDNDPLPF